MTANVQKGAGVAYGGFYLEAIAHDARVTQQALSVTDPAVDEDLFERFLTHEIHKVLEVCCDLRPTVDISVVA